MSSVTVKVLHTLRGHERSVTATVHYTTADRSLLISGDQEGTLIAWNLNQYRLLTKHKLLAKSQVQALKVLKLANDVLFVHTRDNGVKLFVLETIIDKGASPSTIVEIKSFRSHDSLFSRGDAISIEGGRAILAYPYELENHIVSVVLIDPLANTLIAGNARRYPLDCSKTSSVFDMLLMIAKNGSFNLYVSYEDGCICIFGFTETSTTSIQSLNTVGLKLSLINEYNLGTCDFVSAFDVIEMCNSETRTAVCGSPGNKLILIHHAIEPSTKELNTIDEIKLAKSGVSAIAIQPDNNLVAVARWGKNVDLYCMKTRELVAILDQHSQQVSSLSFMNSSTAMQEAFPLQSEINGHPDEKVGGYLLFCASMEGTISVSSIH